MAPLVVAYVDVVGLKAVNDSLGHAAGEQTASQFTIGLLGRRSRPSARAAGGCALVGGPCIPRTDRQDLEPANGFPRLAIGLRWPSADAYRGRLQPPPSLGFSLRFDQPRRCTGDGARPMIV